MTSPASSPSSTARLIQAVQISRRKVSGLGADDVWRPYLLHLTGIESLRAMSAAQLRAVLDDLSAKEAPTPGRVKKANRWKGACDQAKLVLTLWLELHRLGAVKSRDDAAIDAFVKRQTGLDSAKWLTDPTDAQRVIEPLKAWIGRTKRRQPEEGVGDG